MEQSNVITPSILSAAYTRPGDAMRSVPAAGADRVHFDVMGEAEEAFAECVEAHPAPPSARPGRAGAEAGTGTLAGSAIFGRRDCAQVITVLRAELIGDA